MDPHHFGRYVDPSGINFGGHYQTIGEAIGVTFNYRVRSAI